MTAGPCKAKQYDDPRIEVARKRLRESAGQADALEAVREIVANLLGCEQIGLYTVSHGKDHGKDQGTSSLLWSFGIDPAQHATLAVFEKEPLRRVLQGEVHVAKFTDNKSNESSSQPLRVFIPIRLNGRTVAVLVMLKLLPQKVDFDETDINLVTLLSNEAGKSLFEGSKNAHA
jgi:hypothetical protein